MLNFFKRKNPIEALAKLNQDYSDVNYYSLAINHEQTNFQVVLENTSKSIIDLNQLNNKNYLQIIRDDQNLFRSQVKFNDELFKKFETFRHFPIMSIVMKETKALKQIERKEASQDEEKAFEWIKTSLNNMTKAIEEVQRDSSKILNMSYFYQQKSQLINLFNVSFGLKIIDNSLQVMYFEDQVENNKVIKAQEPKWVFNFRTYHPEVMDLFVALLNQLAKIELTSSLQV